MVHEPSARPRLANLCTFKSREDYILENRFSYLHQTVLALLPFGLEPLLQQVPSHTIDEKDANGYTALHWAALRGDSHSASLLLSAGADNKSTDNHGSTVLTAAIRSDNPECVQKVLEGDCDINHTDTAGQTPLHRSCRYSNNVELTNTLLTRGANINAKNALGYTSLMIATFNKHTRVAKFLIDQGADLNIQASNGECALHHAIMVGDHETVHSLLERGADYRVRTNAKEIFLHYAARRTGDKNVIKVLLSFDLKGTEGSNECRSLSSTALQIASSSTENSDEWLGMFSALVLKFQHGSPHEDLKVC